MKVVANVKDFEKNFKNYFDNVIKEANRATKNIGNALIELAENNAKKRLDRATPKDPHSAGLIEEVKNNIESGLEKSDNNEKAFILRVKPDKESLNVFLEYGTGIVGKSSLNWYSTGLFIGHPEAKSAGWDYAINENISYIRRAGKKGWFFWKPESGFNYIDKNDESPAVIVQKRTKRKEFVRAYTRIVNGKPVNVRRSMRKRPHGDKEITSRREYPNWVFSEGIKPVAYMYNTKKELESIVSELTKRTAGRISRGKTGSTIMSAKNWKTSSTGFTKSLDSWEQTLIEKINSKRL